MRCLAACAAPTAALFFCTSLQGLQKPESPPVRVGMIRSLFDPGEEEKVIFGQMRPFADMVKKRTGVEGDFAVSPNVAVMGRELKEGKLQLGVVHGIEYAWLKKHCPDCRPLLVADVGTAKLTALVLVPKTSEAKHLADLKGKPLAVPRRLSLVARLYVEREVRAGLSSYFKLSEAKNADDAIEEAVEGKAAAVLVTNGQAEVYQSRKPGRYNRLRVLAESIPFPPGTVVYRPAQGREMELARFREALLKCDETPEGRQTLILWRLEGFREVPPDYEQIVEAAGSKYPEK